MENFGSIGTEFNYKHKDSHYSASAEWTSLKASDFVGNIDEYMVELYPKMPERI